MIPNLPVFCERLTHPALEWLRKHGDLVFAILGYSLAIGILLMIGLRYPVGRVVKL